MIATNDISELFKIDKDGIPYLTSKDIKTEKIYVPQINNAYSQHATFYGIEGVDNYIIKDSTMYPYFNNRRSHLKLLKELITRQKDIDKVDFPVAYYLSYMILKGIVIPYYKDYRSLRYIINIYPSLDKLPMFYNKESDLLDNLISLFLDIFEIVVYLFSHGIQYIDINTSNFMILNSIIKIIDFDPRFVHFHKNMLKDMKKALIQFEEMVNKVLEMYRLYGVKFKSGEDFFSTEKNILALRKRLER